MNNFIKNEKKIKIFRLFIYFSIVNSMMYSQKMLFHDYVRDEEITEIEIGERKRTYKRPLFFSEVQLKYGMFQNFLIEFLDRPLYFDRSMRYPAGEFAFSTKESFIIDWGIAKLYEFDGLGCMDSGPKYELTDGFLREMGQPKNNLRYFPMFGYERGHAGGGLNSVDANVKRFEEILRIAVNSPYTARPNGKMLFPTYHSSSGYEFDNMDVGLSMEQHAQIINVLQKKFGDTFNIACELSQGAVGVGDNEKYYKLGELLSQDKILKYCERAQKILDVFGALQIRVQTVGNTSGYMDDLSPIPDVALFEKSLLPALSELFSAPHNRGRIIVCSVFHGMINEHAGVVIHEYGTARLRHALNTVLKINPDCILFYEWNEFYENTHFQPTIYNSKALLRIIRFYARTLRGELLSPLTGDDLNIPNIVLSHRTAIKLGERLQFELLNIPDAPEKKQYKINLVLRSINDDELMSFPEETFFSEKLQAITYTIPSEQLAEQSVVLPILTIIMDNGEKRCFSNFQFVRIYPTLCRNYRSIRQPLRDMLLPEKVSFNILAQSNYGYQVTASVKTAELLSSLEILDNGLEVAAVDKKNEFNPEENCIIVGTLSTKTPFIANLQIQVDSATNWDFRPWESPLIKINSWRRDAGGVIASIPINLNPNRFILNIPKKDIDTAKIHICVEDESWLLPLKNLVASKRMAKVFSNCRLDIQDFLQLADIPIRINNNHADILRNLKSVWEYPVYQLRVISESGKIFHSKPIIPKVIKSKGIELNVFSESTCDITTVKVAKELIPDIKYIFDPNAGDVLRNTADDYFDAQLGGGFVYAEPYHFNPLPEGQHNPKWKKEGRYHILSFNGISEYVNFPFETFPRGSFLIEFEMKPDRTAKTQVLFRHMGTERGSISTFLLPNGKLYAVYTDNRLRSTHIDTELELSYEQWSKIKINYDLYNLIFFVNDDKFEMPFGGRASRSQPAVFGGPLRMGIAGDLQYFQGALRSLRILHNNE